MSPSVPTWPSRSSRPSRSPLPRARSATARSSSSTLNKSFVSGPAKPAPTHCKQGSLHMKTSFKTLLALAAAGFAAPALAQEPTVADVMTNVFHLQYAMDTFYFLVCGALVMWMAAGFSMLEAGLVRGKNTAENLTKNISLFSISCVMYLVCGYAIMYGGGIFLSGRSEEHTSELQSRPH